MGLAGAKVCQDMKAVTFLNKKLFSLEQWMETKAFLFRNLMHMHGHMIMLTCLVDQSEINSLVRYSFFHFPFVVIGQIIVLGFVSSPWYSGQAITVIITEQ